MNRSCRLLFLVLVFVAWVHGAAAADTGGPVLLWKVEGLMNPESAVFNEAHNIIYVSNVNGAPNDKDGKGFISRVSPDGGLIKLHWVQVLNGPKRMAIHKERLYVSDIDQLVEINVATGEIMQSYDTPGAQFLNDVTATPDGTVYVSDMVTDNIHRLHQGNWSVWLHEPALNSPNGLLYAGDRLLVASWGSAEIGQQGNGALLAVSLQDKSILSESKEAFGHLDGLEQGLDGSYYVSDWSAGLIYRVKRDGHHELLLQLDQGSADIAYIAKKDTLLVPMMRENTLHAYKMHADE